MIRFINCMKRKPEFTTEQFREYWNDPQFTTLIERIAAQTGASLYAKNATLMVAANDLVRELRGSSEPFDGVLEYWWDNTTHLNELTETEEGRALADEMLDYQRQFVDLSASSAFFVEG